MIRTECNSSQHFPLVSVMIPMYKVASFVERCLQSVYEQSYPNMEVILINDASPDNTLTVVEQTIAQHSGAKRTVLYSFTQNVGLAGARQKALELSNGDYLLFLDADDYWDNNRIVEEWVAVAQTTQAPVVISDYIATYPQREIVHRIPRIENGRALCQAILRGAAPGFMWNKLFERSHFLRFMGKWEQGQNVLEDFGVVVPLLYHTDRVAYYEQPTVHYVQMNNHSYIKNLSLQQLQSILALIKRIESYFLVERDDETMRISVEQSYILVKRMLINRVPWSQYDAIRAIKPEYNHRIGGMPINIYDKATFYCQMTPLLSGLGYLMNFGKQTLKYLLKRN